MTSGIYALVFQNGWRYVGSSKNIEARVRMHETSLRKGVHYNPHLQHCWNKYQDMQVVVLQQCGPEREVLLAAEQLHIDAVTKKLLNSSRIAAYPEGTPTVLQGRSERAKAQHAAGKLGAATVTKEGRRRIIEAVSRALKGRKQRPESVAKMRKACKERWTTELREEQRQRANLQYRKKRARIFGLEIPT